MGKIPERWRGGGTGGRGIGGRKGGVHRRTRMGPPGGPPPLSPKNSSSDRATSPNNNFLLSRWLPYNALGKRVPGTRFIAFKVPLKQSLVSALRPIERFTPGVLLERCPSLGLIIDLTNTNRYYEKSEFLRKGVEYKKINCPGQSIPTDDRVAEFFNVVDDYLERHSRDDTLIGVHCTHGVNRTGYFLARYMLQRMAYPFNTVIENVERARGYNIERPNYIEQLKTCTQLVPKFWNWPKGELEKDMGMGLAKEPPPSRDGRKSKGSPFDRHFSPRPELKARQEKYGGFGDKIEYRGEGSYRPEALGRSPPWEYGAPEYNYREAKPQEYGPKEDVRRYRGEERWPPRYRTETRTPPPQPVFHQAEVYPPAPYEYPKPEVPLPDYRRERYGGEEPRRPEGEYYKAYETGGYGVKGRPSASPVPRGRSPRRRASPYRAAWPYREEERRFSPFRPPPRDYQDRHYDRGRSESPRYRKERTPEGKQYRKEPYPREYYEARAPSPPPRREPSPRRSYKKDPSPYRGPELKRRARTPSPSFRGSSPLLRKKYKKDRPSPPHHYQEKKHYYDKVTPPREKTPQSYGKSKRETEHESGRRGRDRKESVGGGRSPGDYGWGKRNQQQFQEEFRVQEAWGTSGGDLDCRVIINQKRLSRPGEQEQPFFEEPFSRPLTARLGPSKFPPKKFPPKSPSSRPYDKKKPFEKRRR